MANKHVKKNHKSLGKCKLEPQGNTTTYPPTRMTKKIKGRKIPELREVVERRGKFCNYFNYAPLISLLDIYAREMKHLYTKLLVQECR